jgi:hypothetical protein
LYQFDKRLIMIGNKNYRVELTCDKRQITLVMNALKCANIKKSVRKRERERDGYETEVQRKRQFANHFLSNCRQSIWCTKADKRQVAFKRVKEQRKRRENDHEENLTRNVTKKVSTRTENLKNSDSSNKKFTRLLNTPIVSQLPC